MQKYELDKVIGLFVVFFIGFGLVQLYSASFIYSMEYYGHGYHFFLKQLIFSALAIFTLFLTAKIPWAFWQNYGIWICALSIILIGVTLLPGVGGAVGGARRWIRTPFFFNIEPSELFKASLPFLTAFFVLNKDSALKNKKFLLRAACFFIPLFLLLKQPDFGSFFISAVLIFITFFVFGMAWKWVFVFMTTLSFSSLALIVTSPYRYERLRVFLNPWLSPLDSGFQVIQSFLSFNLGGFWGTGLGNGQSKLFFLPEAHTDFIFSVFAEEWGFVGVASMITLIFLFIYVGFYIVQKTENKFAKAVALGIVLNYALTIFINLGVVTGFLPTKGLVFPFLSYGGSHLLSLSWSMGVLMCIERYNKQSFMNRQRLSPL